MAYLKLVWNFVIMLTTRGVDTPRREEINGRLKFLSMRIADAETVCRKQETEQQIQTCK